MAWLGEELPKKQQAGRTPFASRCLALGAISRRSASSTFGST
jgi:hypothetical protein